MTYTDPKLASIYFNQVLLKEDAGAAMGPIAGLAVEQEKHSETNMSNPEEHKEVTIGKRILELIKGCETTDASYIQTLRDIKTAAQELVDMHKA